MGWACSPVPLPRAGGHTLAGCILQCDTGKSTFPLGTALLSLGICKALRRHSGRSCMMLTMLTVKTVSQCL